VLCRAAWSRRRQPRVLDGECSVGSCRRHSRPEPGRDLVDAPAIEMIGIRTQRNPHIRARLKLLTVETGSNDADDRVRHAPESDCLSDDVLVTPEAANPQAVAQNGHGRPVGTIFIGAEGAARDYPCTKQTKEGV